MADQHVDVEVYPLGPDLLKGCHKRTIGEGLALVRREHRQTHVQVQRVGELLLDGCRRDGLHRREVHEVLRLDYLIFRTGWQHEVLEHEQVVLVVGVNGIATDNWQDEFLHRVLF